MFHSNRIERFLQKVKNNTKEHSIFFWEKQQPSKTFSLAVGLSRVHMYESKCVMQKKKKKKILLKVEQNCKYNTSEFAITTISHTMYNKIYNIYNKIYK